MSIDVYTENISNNLEVDLIQDSTAYALLKVAYRALLSVSSRLQSHQLAIDTIVDHLVNMNTTAYKGYDYEFTTLFCSILSSGTSSGSTTGRGYINPTPVGYGATTRSSSQNFEQRSFDVTGNPLDMALEEDGFFMDYSALSAVSYIVYAGIDGLRLFYVGMTGGKVGRGLP